MDPFLCKQQASRGVFLEADGIQSVIQFQPSAAVLCFFYFYFFFSVVYFSNVSIVKVLTFEDFL